MVGRTATGDLPEDRDGFRFRGGNLALDLTATLVGRLRAERRELLASAADLDRWLAAAGLGSQRTAASDADLAAARELREAIYTLASEAGPRFDRHALMVVNSLAAEADCRPTLMADGTVTRSGSPSALLSHLAREAIDLFGAPGAERVRQCQSPSCAIMFVDTSRSGDRRWCSMSACGNKAKVAEFRRRRRTSVAE